VADQIGTGTMESVSSGVTARTLTMPWIGAAVDQEIGEFVIGDPGGHNDGGNNSVYVFPVRVPSPAWVRRRAGTGVTGDGTTNGSGTDGTGQPVDTHSYHRPVIAAGRFWLPSLDSQSGVITDGNWTTATFSINHRDSGQSWRQHGRLSSSTGGSNWLGGSAAYDPVTDRIFSFPQTLETGSNGAYFDVSDVVAAGDVTYPGTVTGVTAIATPNRGGGFYNCAIYCASLRRLVLLSEDNDNTGTFHSLQLDNLGAGWTSHTVSGTQPWGPYYNGGCVWHDSARRFYSYNSGGNAIRVITVPETVTNNWTGTTYTATGDTLPGTSSDNGSAGFSRWNIVQDMGNGDACLLWYPNHTVTGMYVIRVSSTGLVGS
jgi:hypothetical protein